MKYDKQTLIDGKKHSIEVLERRIAELSKPCLPRYRHLRSAERDLLRKKSKTIEEGVGR